MTMPKTAVATDRGYSAYIIELDPAALDAGSMAEANPDARHDLPPLYVGQTWRTPIERFRQHKNRIKSSWMVRRFGVKLRRDLMLVFGRGRLRTRGEAEAEEARLTLALRAAGYAVWSN
jgi:hypothetical protein